LDFVELADVNNSLYAASREFPDALTCDRMTSSTSDFHSRISGMHVSDQNVIDVISIVLTTLLECTFACPFGDGVWKIARGKISTVVDVSKFNKIQTTKPF